MFSIGKHLTILPSVDSTNNYAMAQVRAGLAKSGDAWFTMHQTAGKGQRGKQWKDAKGQNILMSIALQPPGLLLSQQFLLSAAVALACYDFFSQLAGEETSIKWPNDLYWRDRKAGGILIENIIGIANANANSNSSSSHWQWSIIGTGININQVVFPEHLPNPVSLKQITGKTNDVSALAKKLCSCLELRLQQLEKSNSLLEDYNQHLYARGKTVKLKKGTRIFDAGIQKVTVEGKLVVTTSMEEEFEFGEVEWLIL
jgi:BirA family transcriptional regulator, biotin operon repressor / biotin---[acetyl-CoA-carboxylase] ligase